MSTFNERQKKVTRKKNIKIYSHWISEVRCIGIENNMTLSEVKKEFNIDTIVNMFRDNKTPQEAYKVLTKIE